MFDFLLSEEKKTRRHAANWLEVADRVYKFRRDQLTDTQGQRLVAATGELKQRLKERVDASKLKMAIEKLEGTLRETGGSHYPVSSWVENVEFFLVAAIVILGLRAYFVQPFKIPTNSMWPSYYGMTHESFKDGEEPGLIGRAARLLAFGAFNYSAVAPASGEVRVAAIQVGANSLQLIPTEKAGRTLGIIPAAKREYSFSVGGKIASVQVPADWRDLEQVLEEKLDLPEGGLGTYLFQQARRAGDNLERSVMTITYGGRKQEIPIFWVPLGRAVKEGEPIVSFDILTGDLLFVDRITYNFFPPKVGQGFVFKTENIHSRHMQDQNGDQIKQYYIKRLVGVPGDTLEIKAPALWRNGKPIDGAAAFDRNAKREGIYPGYTYANDRFGVEMLTGPGATIAIPEGNFFAMGDNSPRSQDSRYWGFVPEKEVVGKPLFIYYPLTKRWGLAK